MWDSDELFQLVQAWEEVVDDPKNRLLLSTGERSTLHARFCAISGSSKRSLLSVTRQQYRLCLSYRLIVETNKKSRKHGTPRWFDLSPAEQHELRRSYNKKEKGLPVVTLELFRRLDRICGEKAPEKTKAKGKRIAPKESKASKRSQSHKNTEDLEEESNDGQKIAWTARDWALFVDSWQAAVDEFIEQDHEPDENLKLPNWLLRQKFVEFGGLQETSVGTITAKKRCIIQSYHFIRQCVAALEELDGSDWFDLTFNERFRLQRKLVSPKSSQRVGCEIDRDTYLKVGAILEKEEELGTMKVTGRKRKRVQKKVRKASISSEESSESSMTPSPSPPPSDDADDVSEADSDVQSPSQPGGVYKEEKVLVDEKVVEALLEAQNARFERLMHDLREERLEERKQNQAMLLEILHQRTPREDSVQNVSDLESLIQKQQEQLVDLFAQMHKERQQERGDFHALVRQLCFQP
ncbi:hypothetical protein PsorP6_006153 [Peronosclerospora sorghi]|uniref:Uncharacterized protein n=1 Tax=Peronosclerospora sorghi TaxID=230839 RepID=A0ACC0W6W1_9STRA|nr:hypothetical protein PsorP6_006153 [Peronosclerospora sorghi]